MSKKVFDARMPRFTGSCNDPGITIERPIAGRPHLRGAIERIFGDLRLPPRHLNRTDSLRLAHHARITPSNFHPEKGTLQ